MKAVFLDFNSLNQNDLEISRLQQQFDQLTLHAVTAPDEILERVQNADVIITNKVRVNAELIRQLPKLKLILISATGTNNVDLSAAREHNIVVCNCQGYGTPAVAQHTLLL
ncbi:MAG TPA: glycerate dehydrogenase, partial [Acinetobacter radioresistens]|nr:glycerate dehydrogenase [Acinetobacter radioresistens]